METKTQAEENLLALKRNPYPGRGIIVGMDETGKYLIQVYFIMGRSENSRNRIFVKEQDGLLKTEPADKSKVQDPTLVIYTAMAEKHFISTVGNSEHVNTIYAVSNGKQTLDSLKSEEGLQKLIENWEYEPDAPNYTPRITSSFNLFRPTGIFSTEISLIKKSSSTMECERFLYTPQISPGLGHCITTYSGNGNPLPSFNGEPYVLPLIGDIKNVANTIWNSLNEDNRISLAVKFINIENGYTIIDLINKNKTI